MPNETELLRAARRRIIDFLRTTPLVDRLNFELFYLPSTRVHVYPDAYRGVARALEQGHVTIEFVDRFEDPDIGGKYSSSRNVFYFKEAEAIGRNIKKSLIIHEATHAVIDRAGIGQHCAITNECAAYLAETAAVYIESPLFTYPRDQPIHIAARPLAARLIDQRQYLFTGDDVSRLWRTIQGDHLYADFDEFISDTFQPSEYERRQRERHERNR